MSQVTKTICDGCDAEAVADQAKSWAQISFYTIEPNSSRGQEEVDGVDLCPHCYHRWLDNQPINWPRVT